MKEIISQNTIITFIFIAAVLMVAIFLLVKVMQSIGMEKVRKIVYKAFIVAEEVFQHGDNESKFNYVVRIAKDTIPSPFNLFITESTLRKVVQTWFDLCKDFLDDGKFNGSEKKGE